MALFYIGHSSDCDHILPFLPCNGPCLFGHWGYTFIHVQLLLKVATDWSWPPSWHSTNCGFRADWWHAFFSFNFGSEKMSQASHFFLVINDSWLFVMFIHLMSVTFHPVLSFHILPWQRWACHNPGVIVLQCSHSYQEWGLLISF